MLYASAKSDALPITLAWQQLRDWVRDALIWPTEGTPDLPEACAATP